MKPKKCLITYIDQGNEETILFEEMQEAIIFMQENMNSYGYEDLKLYSMEEKTFDIIISLH